MVAQIAFLAFSLLVSLLFFLYGFNLYYLLSAARRYRPPDLPPTSGYRPTVAIHLPVYNEKYVVRRLVDACAAVVRTYGTERASILVIDDSDDDTAGEIDEIVIAVASYPIPFVGTAQAARPIAALVLENAPWVLLALMIGLCTVAAWITPMVVLRAQNRPVMRNLSSLLVLFMLGCGVSLNNTIEAGKALLTNRDWAFKRTPKYAIRRDKGEWRDKRYQVPLDYVCVLELVCACLGGVAMGYAAWYGSFGVLLILLPYTAAYAFVFWLTIRQSRQGEGA